MKNLIGFVKLGKGIWGDDKKVQSKDILGFEIPERTSEIINDGSDGFNPFITAKELVGAKGNSVLSSSPPIWIDDYNFIMPSASYIIRGTQYSFPQTLFTLDPSSEIPDRNRKDTMAGTFDSNGNGYLKIVKGDEAEIALLKELNQETEIYITHIDINAQTSAPSQIINLVQFNENSSDVYPNGASVIGDSVNSPYSGAVCIEATDLNEQEFYIKADLDYNAKSFASQQFVIQSTIGKWINNETLKIAYVDENNTRVSDYVIIDSKVDNAARNPFAFNSHVNLWQIVSIPISAFNIATESVRGIVIRKDDNKDLVSFKMDLINLQGGIEVSSPSIVIEKTSEIENNGATGDSKYVEHSELGSVATSNDYEDLDNKPENLESNYTIDIIGNQLKLYKDNIEVGSEDLSVYLDNTNLSRVVSSSFNNQTGIATFTRDDATTFTLDLSDLTGTTEMDLMSNMTESKTTPIDADNLTLWDSVEGKFKQFGFGNLKGFLNDFNSEKIDFNTSLKITKQTQYSDNFTQTTPLNFTKDALSSYIGGVYELGIITNGDLITFSTDFEIARNEYELNKNISGKYRFIFALMSDGIIGVSIYLTEESEVYLDGEYLFSGNLYDTSGNLNNGTYSGNVALASDRNSNANSAYVIQGTSLLPSENYITLGGDGDYNIGAEGVSYAFWMQYGGGDLCTYFDYGSDSNKLFVGNNGLTLGSFICLSTVGYGAVRRIVTDVKSDSGAHFIVVSITSSYICNIYIDDMEVPVASNVDITGSDITGTLRIGYVNNKDNQILDNMYIAKRVFDQNERLILKNKN